MLAMQYTIVLPDDHDMALIRERIRAKGPLLDGFDGLLFKSYLYACRGEDGPRNLYAPLYVWRDTAGMDRFLRGPGFAALSADFGRPAVSLWAVSRRAGGVDLRQARWATLTDEGAEGGDELPPGALASVAIYDPGRWSSSRFTLWRDEPPAPRFRVGYVAMA